MTEQQAIERLKDGDIGGLELLVRQHQTEALRAVYLIVRDRATAEDIVQAAFIRVYERIAQFDTERPFRPWFLRSVINDALKVTSRQSRYISLDAVLEEAESALVTFLKESRPSPDDLVEISDTRQTVWQALSKLSPVQRAAIVQRYYLGMSEAEMADRTVCPPGTIKWRLYAAKKRLRTLLGPFG